MLKDKYMHPHPEHLYAHYTPTPECTDSLIPTHTNTHQHTHIFFLSLSFCLSISLSLPLTHVRTHPHPRTHKHIGTHTETHTHSVLGECTQRGWPGTTYKRLWTASLQRASLLRLPSHWRGGRRRWRWRDEQPREQRCQCAEHQPVSARLSSSSSRKRCVYW